MKTIALLALAVAALFVLPSCVTEVESDTPSARTSTTTSESTRVHTPVGTASQSTTVRSY